MEDSVPPSTFWRIIRIIPAIILLLTFLMLLGMFLAGGLIRISSWYLLQSLMPLMGLITLVFVVIYAVVRRRFSRLMAITTLLALLALVPAITLIRPIPFPASIESASPAATVRLPSDAPLQVAWGGDRLETNYHAVAPDQRWAYDLFIAPFLLGTPDLASYGCYGTPVLAPVDGVVIQAHDGEPDEVPGVVSNNLTVPTGNHVSIQMESGTYLVIAHLREGSLRVATGDMVREGEEIGECGNSGNTSEPHIHIHHQRQDPNEYPFNFAEGLPLYFRDHDGAPMPIGGFRIEGENVFPTGDLVQHVR
ncbi:MAG: M23 family metallopeptidase [Anaerolineales bacterium]|nr:M23 family metallopeptidase [Anaerolineales bacterium]